MPLKTLLRRKASTQGLPGERIYAIGDIHGRLDLLDELMARIDRDMASRPPMRTRCVILGDFIDRGLQSSAVMTRLAELDPDKYIVLKGNHEAALLDTLRGDHDAAEVWARFGGVATLASFGVSADSIDPEDSGQLISLARRVIPAPLADWLAQRPLSFRAGGYYFVHAGVRPGVALARQTEADLLWIRDMFTESDADHGAIIVHGHSIREAGAEIMPNRIGIDTGAYRTGRLSAVGLEGDQVWTLATGSAPSAELLVPAAARISEAWAPFRR
ncbi:metallophosphoesterase [Polymorphobacter multimanifer]|uniref:Serine/threonine protein phosphatase 1 n=1 Tax=Polymorphobacter multimanifer TaxID=1070431 RepID=A0A841LBP6_9SPHN|nr:metallophosphoesterase family protein [Polymorphobacter multimanifer]MBB6226428.1 serine/threonine protein phosphatase 1 [Polymorphobacter multimanifer]GGI67686.1 metallophosphoesterase [Polymorphobacter multimanifer]